MAGSAASCALSGGAAFSACGHYRWWLQRLWAPERPRVLVVGLNPSRADAQRDDDRHEDHFDVVRDARIRPERAVLAAQPVERLLAHLHRCLVAALHRIGEPRDFRLEGRDCIRRQAVAIVGEPLLGLLDVEAALPKLDTIARQADQALHVGRGGLAWQAEDDDIAALGRAVEQAPREVGKLADGQ